ncbi:hypothetical protein [Curtobacterium sp. UNCCL20]|uniref:hypothetical protein n=1 Tax=Curtobacterium sp. UNCCL20 TaxID=1502773 RepID=UPI000B86364E|nr:hypothetical protein [Curtobacterium sp. UNCCL20]
MNATSRYGISFLSDTAEAVEVVQPVMRSAEHPIVRIRTQLVSAAVGHGVIEGMGAIGRVGTSRAALLQAGIASLAALPIAPFGEEHLGTAYGPWD